MQQLRAEDPKAAATAQALLACTGGPLCYGGQARWLRGGRGCVESLLADIRAAERSVVLEPGRVRPGVVWDTVLMALRQRAARGVAVELLIRRAPGLREAEYMRVRVERPGPFVPEPRTAVIDGRIRYAGLPDLCDAVGLRQEAADVPCLRWVSGEGYGYAMPLGPGAVRTAVRSMVCRAERSVWLQTPGPEPRLADALRLAGRSGAEVRICAGRTTACCVDGTAAVSGGRGGGLWVCGDGAAELETLLEGAACRWASPHAIPGSIR